MGSEMEITKITAMPIEKYRSGSEEGSRIINESIARKLGVYPLETDSEKWLKAMQKEVKGILTVNVIVADYCHDIRAAWKIVEACSHWCIKKVIRNQCQEWTYVELVFKEWAIREEFQAEPALAICLAFLKLR